MAMSAVAFECISKIASRNERLQVRWSMEGIQNCLDPTYFRSLSALQAAFRPTTRPTPWPTVRPTLPPTPRHSVGLNRLPSDQHLNLPSDQCFSQHLSQHLDHHPSQLTQHHGNDVDSLMRSILPTSCRVSAMGNPTLFLIQRRICFRRYNPFEFFFICNDTSLFVMLLLYL
jgi:hypothetical protein